MDLSNEELHAEDQGGSLSGRYYFAAENDLQYIVSINAPNIRLRVAPGLTVTRSALRSFEPKTIFLDGVFAGPPFHDIAKHIYSLDHHEGCVRSMTLATCEQAAVVLVSGLPLDEGLWTLIINEPDLDSILACWVLMNHLDLLRENAELLASVMPLLRTEGNIDAYGLGKEVLAALPVDVYLREQQRLSQLMQPILALKAAGRWVPDEYEALVIQLLNAIDRLVLPQALLGQLCEHEQLGQVLLRDQKLAVLCQSPHGIYEVEEHLRLRYGKTLGIIVLKQADGKFTLRRSDSFAVQPFEKLYKVLNRADANAIQGKDSDNRWGGADDIGGSPRETGSALSGMQVLACIERIYGQPKSFWTWFVGFMTAQRRLPSLGDLLNKVKSLGQARGGKSSDGT